MLKLIMRMIKGDMVQIFMRLPEHHFLLAWYFSLTILFFCLTRKS